MGGMWVDECVRVLDYLCIFEMSAKVFSIFVIRDPLKFSSDWILDSTFAKKI